MTLKTKVVVGAVTLLLLGFGIYKGKFSGTKAIPNQTAKVEKGTLVISVSASGQISAANSAFVNTNAGGVIKKVYVQNGQKVYSGQPIVEVDLDRESYQKYVSALTTYESAKAAVYTLQTTLFSTNQKLINDAVARGLTKDDPTYIQQNATWLAAESAYKNQQNSLSSSWLSLSLVSPIIYSPISGTLSGLSLQVGSVISGTQKIASIKTDAVPLLTLNLTEVDVPKIKTGNKATITMDAFPGKTFTGIVVSIDSVGTVSSGVTVYPTVIKFDTGNIDILANMSAQANIITQTKTDVLLVPSSAVAHLPQGVVTGLASDSQVEIISGLAEGDTIITGTIPSAPSGQTRSIFSGNVFRGGR